MTPTEIKIRMLEKGIRQKDLAVRWNQPRSIVCRLISGQIRTRNLRVKLARAIGVRLADLIESLDRNGKRSN